MRVPLMMRWPARVKAGVVNDFTEHLDLGPTLLEMLGAPGFDMQHGQSLRPHLEGRKAAKPRSHVVSEYLENEEVFVRTERWKLMYGSGKRRRDDGYVTDNPTPGRTVRLYDLKKDPGEFTNVAAQNPKEVGTLQKLALERFRTTHPDAAREPSQTGVEDTLDFYLPPRDAKRA
jgi:choline-sulfatase